MPENEGSGNSLDEVMARSQAEAREQADASARSAGATSAAERAAAESASADRAAAAAAGGGADSGAAPAPASDSLSTEASSAPQTYVVQDGDTLGSISEKVYGDKKHWDTIFEHNKDKISDPDMIHAGQELVIP